LGFSGPKYTWSNRRVDWENIRERLDRWLCNADWQSLFPKVGVRHLTAPNSEHNPILLDTHLELSKGSRPFRFEAMWAREEPSFEMVEKAWQIPVNGAECIQLLKRCQRVKNDYIL
jgi:hypothetical protein